MKSRVGGETESARGPRPVHHIYHPCGDLIKIMSARRRERGQLSERGGRPCVAILYIFEDFFVIGVYGAQGINRVAGAM